MQLRSDEKYSRSLWSTKSVQLIREISFPPHGSCWTGHILPWIELYPATASVFILVILGRNFVHELFKTRGLFECGCLRSERPWRMLLSHLLLWSGAFVFCCCPNQVLDWTHATQWAGLSVDFTFVLQR